MSDAHRGGEQQHGLSRRQLLERGGLLAASVPAASILAACGSSTGTAGSGSTTGGTPRRGGDLTLGVIGGGAAETLDPQKAGDNHSISRIYALYETLYTFESDGRLAPVLAEEASVDKSGSVWTLRLRDGIKFHDGQPLDAKTVRDNIVGWTDPNNAAYGYVGAMIDPAKVRTVDRRTVEVTLKKPNVRFTELLTDLITFITKPGRGREKIVGTGPFVVKSFTPGSSSVFTRNPDYWRSGRPYLDTLTINTTFMGDDALVNALISGQVDAVPGVPALQAKAALNGQGQFNIVRGPNATQHHFYMRVYTAPFDDVRVRQAVRLLLDRTQLVSTVFNGLGSVGYDLAAKQAQFYDTSLTREQDLEQARSLLRSAGHQRLTLSFTNSPTVGHGFREAGALLQAQAAQAGVQINIKSVEAGQYFDPSTLWLKMPFAQSYWTHLEALQKWWAQTLLVDSPYSETHWRSARTEQLFAEVGKARDVGLARELWHELQLEQFNSGGHIIWGFADSLDGVAHRVNGIQPSPSGPLGNWAYSEMWLAA